MKNEASQRLFEKLGAIPDGVVPIWKGHPEVIERIEEENLSQIDEAAESLPQWSAHIYRHRKSQGPVRRSNSHEP